METLGLVVYTCNPNYVGRLRQEDHKFEASLGNLARPCLKEKKKKRHMDSFMLGG
jgi:hypothetical protein